MQAKYLRIQEQYIIHHKSTFFENLGILGRKLLYEGGIIFEFMFQVIKANVYYASLMLVL